MTICRPLQGHPAICFLKSAISACLLINPALMDGEASICSSAVLRCHSSGRGLWQSGSREVPPIPRRPPPSLADRAFPRLVLTITPVPLSFSPNHCAGLCSASCVCNTHSSPSGLPPSPTSRLPWHQAFRLPGNHRARLSLSLLYLHLINFSRRLPSNRGSPAPLLLPV